MLLHCIASLLVADYHTFSLFECIGSGNWSKDTISGWICKRFGRKSCEVGQGDTNTNIILRNIYTYMSGDSVTPLLTMQDGLQRRGHMEAGFLNEVDEVVSTGT